MVLKRDIEVSNGYLGFLGFQSWFKILTRSWQQGCLDGFFPSATDKERINFCLHEIQVCWRSRAKEWITAELNCYVLRTCFSGCMWYLSPNRSHCYGRRCPRYYIIPFNTLLFPGSCLCQFFIRRLGISSPDIWHFGCTWLCFGWTTICKSRRIWPLGSTFSAWARRGTYDLRTFFRFALFSLSFHSPGRVIFKEGLNHSKFAVLIRCLTSSKLQAILCRVQLQHIHWAAVRSTCNTVGGESDKLQMVDAIWTQSINGKSCRELYWATCASLSSVVCSLNAK